jgi:NAD(P)-dependent dehydrogenase (short-subunit alcohol dehydrogenase family)
VEKRLGSPLRPLLGQVALVTGASSGIGRAVAVSLARHGASVCLVGRNPKRLALAHKEAERHNRSVKTYRTDLTRDRDLRRLVSSVERDFGRLDILVHGAGVIALGPVETAPVSDLDLQYRTNVRAPYVLSQVFLPLLKREKGQIVFVNSSAGLLARANVAQYASTKHALRAIADSLRDEINVDGVRVFSVFLGRTATPMQAAVHEHEGRKYRPESLIQPEQVASLIVATLTLPRDVEVTEARLRPLRKPG